MASTSDTGKRTLSYDAAMLLFCLRLILALVEPMYPRLKTLMFLLLVSTGGTLCSMLSSFGCFALVDLCTGVNLTWSVYEHTFDQTWQWQCKRSQPTLKLLCRTFQASASRV